MDWHTATNEDALAAWDRGETVWACDMGGMGPGYEQCIQIMGFEMLRAMLDHPGDWSKMTGKEGRDEWQKYQDMIEALPEVKAVISHLGPSGAQLSLVADDLCWPSACGHRRPATIQANRHRRGKPRLAKVGNLTIGLANFCTTRRCFD